MNWFFQQEIIIFWPFWCFYSFRNIIILSKVFYSSWWCHSSYPKETSRHHLDGTHSLQQGPPRPPIPFLAWGTPCSWELGGFEGWILASFTLRSNIIHLDVCFTEILCSSGSCWFASPKLFHMLKWFEVGLKPNIYFSCRSQAIK